MKKEVKKKIVKFTDLEAWQEAHRLVLTIYELTKKFPREEIFGLSNQMRRAGVSITSNIAEGFGRNSLKEKIKFYSMAQGSLTELQNQLLIAKDVGYISKQKFEEIIAQTVKIHKIINGLIKKSKSFLSTSSQPPSSYFLLPNSKGIITSYVLVFGVIFLIMLAGLLGFILTQLKISKQKIAWHEAFNIAEAGLEYYKWCLNNNVQNCSTTKSYYDTSGKEIGKFEIQFESNQSCGKLISQKIVSVGYTSDFPNLKRKISTFYAKESVAKYSYILNSNVWVGSDHVINGPYHSNGGIRFDGTNYSTVSSAQSSWVCTASFGCGPQGVGYGIGLCPPECQIINFQCVCPGVFSTTKNSNRDLFLYPVPQFDFAGITVDLAQVKKTTKDNGMGLYFGPSGAFGYHVVVNGEYINVKKVTQVRIIDDLCTVVNDKVICQGDPCSSECSKCQSGRCIVEEPVIQSETGLGNFQIPSDCGTIFFEDNLWIGNENQTSTIKGKITIVSANLTGTSQKTNVWLQGSIEYASSSQVDGLTIISQNNLLIGLYSPNIMSIKGIFVAQNGFFGRNYYPCSKYSPYCIRDKLTITGSIVSSGRVGTQWTNQGGQVISGYLNRETYVDPNLLYNPPIFTPFLSSEFKIVKWEEL